MKMIFSIFMTSQQVGRAPVGVRIQIFYEIPRYTSFESIFSFEYNYQNEIDSL